MKACEHCSTYVSCDVFLVGDVCACVLVDGVGSPLSRALQCLVAVGFVVSGFSVSLGRRSGFRRC